MCADGGSGPQLQRDGGNLRGLLERSGRQSGSQRFRWIGEFRSPPSPSASSWRPLTSCCSPPPLLCVWVPGVCIRPAEIVLLCVGKPWTDHECVHSQMTVPACPAHCSGSRLWLRPTHRQMDGRMDMMQEVGTGWKHQTQQVQTRGWTDGWWDESGPSICVDSTRDADGTRWKVEIKNKKEPEEKLIEEEKSSRSVYVLKFGSYFAFFYLKHGHCHQNAEKKNDKSVDLCY